MKKLLFRLMFLTILLLILSGCDDIFNDKKYGDGCKGEQTSVSLSVTSPFDNIELAYIKGHASEGNAIFTFQRGVNHACVGTIATVSYNVQLDAKFFPDEESRPVVLFNEMNGITINPEEVITPNLANGYLYYVHKSIVYIEKGFNSTDHYSSLTGMLTITIPGAGVEEALESIVMEVGVTIEYEY